MSNSLSKINPADFDKVIDSKKVGLYILKNKNGMEVSVTNFGARIVELFAADKNGEFADVVLGFDSLDNYLNHNGDRFLGCVVGRFGNRIAKGKFSLNGKEYSLDINNGENSLHGGDHSYDMKVWDVLYSSDTEIKFQLVSEDGDSGYPAKLTIDMTYRLTEDDAIEISYIATSDDDTIVNLTNHSFFNLHGYNVGDITDHIMTINADGYTPVDGGLIPTGEVATVEGTPLDFRTPTEIGLRINEDNEQLKFANGYDHNWVLNKSKPCVAELAATVYDPKSGREMKVFTTEPGMQFYAGNFFVGNVAKGNHPLNFRCGLALETQHFPDSPNQPNFPSTVLKKGEVYSHICKYQFSAR